jgi:hypothetical protein
MGSKIGVFILVNGQFVISEFESEGNNFILLNPAAMIPTSDKKLGFAKFLPFSESNSRLLQAGVISVSTPIKGILDAYKEWVIKSKAQDVGIILPGGAK